jgi:pseudouridine synthase
MNKPKGVITTMRDERGRRSVVDLLPDLDVTVKPVGRLDADTEGLLLLTSDGELASRLTHPKYGIWKVYKALATPILSDAQLAKLREGVFIRTETLSRKKTSPSRVRRIGEEPKRDTSTIEIAVHEGAKRQVRLMFEACGARVLSLKRIKYGPIHLGKLTPGQCRVLSATQVSALRAAVGLP